ncbi:MAG: SNARE-like domain protein, partial [Leptospiraceae bacterium]|nr:SNARE-like domain protein [Leptospiraceae bacterium]
RFPNEKNGKIFSITDKEFPVIFGDGKTDLKNLIKSHKRFKFQKDTYYQYLGDKVNSIPKEGVKIPLGFAGNHFQGCLFKDGKDLISEELEKEIDRISKHFKGFYFGRYDIRYETKEDLLKGINFKIVELNGAASESTNLYDPNFNIFQSYKILFSQWKILFKIGYLNYKKGENITSWKEFFGTIFKHFEYKDEVNLFTKES